jgi:hypothetical protein
MASSEQWPPLEQVREWAEYKLANGQPAPAATRKYRNLIILIDEILAARGQGNAPGVSSSDDDSRLKQPRV